MEDEKNKKWWELRSKHGRDTLFSSPELLWSEACEYFFNEDKDDYWKKTEVVGQFQGSVIDKEYVVKTPYTWEGLCLFLRCSVGYFNTFKYGIRKRKEEGISNESDEYFLMVIEMIDMVIKKQQINGAASGFFKENIISRYLGLRDKSSTELSNPEGESFNLTLKIE